jgi:hypothetical protein
VRGQLAGGTSSTGSGSPWLAGLGVTSSANTSSAARLIAWVRRACLSSALSPGTSGPAYSARTPNATAKGKVAAD